MVEENSPAVTAEQQTSPEGVPPPQLPHVLVLSYPSQGHVNPMLRFAKRIAAKGLLVTFSSSLDIGLKIMRSTSTTSVASAADAGTVIGSGRLRFEFFEDGWEPEDPRRNELAALMNKIESSWPSAVLNLAKAQAAKGRPLSCIVGNPFLPWSLDVADELNLPSAVLWVQSAAVFSTYYHYEHSLVVFPTEEDPNASVTLPGVSIMKADEIPTFLLPTNPYKSLTEAILAQFRNLSKATWIFGNTFEELEKEPIQALSSLCPVIPVGPLLETEEENSNIRGDLWRAADCIGWLDGKPPRSVVYVSVGSVVVLDKEEMRQLAYGLRDSKRPFLWIVRDAARDLLPENFSQETKDQGLIVPWCPQDKVLNHESVACFVSHCGWNSTLEALSYGVPVVAFPQWGDQVPDAKFIEEVYKMGVRLKAPIEGAELVKCVEGATNEVIRKTAAKWKEAARAAVAGGGSSDKNVADFVDEILRRAASAR